MGKEIGIQEVREITEAIHESIGIDFSNYAFSSLRRRIERFIETNKVKDLDYFIENIKDNLSYTDRLVNEITVNVTDMFRDPSFWSYLRENVLPLIGRHSFIKIWHAACSTGEEVFSMAIILKEAGLLDKTRIIATDLNRNVLQVAKVGAYPVKNLEIYDSNYKNSGGKGKLSDYYTIVNREVIFDSQLIKNVDFRRHDLAKEELSSSFDLIVCRNVLIYFNFELQEKVIQTFSKSMSDGSFLAIGSKESINWCRTSRFFVPECMEEKIYRKREKALSYNSEVA